MGKLVTKGTATREIDYYKVAIKVEFYSSEMQTKNAIKKVTEECEQFLKQMKENGYDTTEITAGSNSVRKGWYHDDKEVRAERSIYLEEKYSLEFIDFIMKIIEDGSYNADISIYNRVEDEAKIQKELAEEAASIARKKAEFLAGATGTKIVGVSRIKTEHEDDYIFDEDELDDVFDEDEKIDNQPRYMRACCERSEEYIKLKKPQASLSADVYIEWILEDK